MQLVPHNFTHTSGGHANPNQILRVNGKLMERQRLGKHTNKVRIVWAF